MAGLQIRFVRIENIEVQEVYDWTPKDDARDYECDEACILHDSPPDQMPAFNCNSLRRNILRALSLMPYLFGDLADAKLLLTSIYAYTEDP